MAASSSKEPSWQHRVSVKEATSRDVCGTRRRPVEDGHQVAEPDEGTPGLAGSARPLKREQDGNTRAVHEQSRPVPAVPLDPG
jgi:hypothetical protein